MHALNAWNVYVAQLVVGFFVLGKAYVIIDDNYKLESTHTGSNPKKVITDDQRKSLILVINF